MLLHDSLIWILEKDGCSFIKIFCDEDVKKDISKRYLFLTSIQYEELMDLIEEKEDYCFEKEEEYDPFDVPKLTDYGLLITLGNLSMHSTEDFLSYHNASEVLGKTLKTLITEYPDMRYEGYIAYTAVDTHAGEVCQWEISSDKNADTADKVYDYLGEALASAMEYDDFWDNLANELDDADEADFKRILKCFYSYSQWLDDSVYDNLLELADEILDGEFNDELNEFLEALKNGEDVELEDDEPDYSGLPDGYMEALNLVMFAEEEGLESGLKPRQAMSIDGHIDFTVQKAEAGDNAARVTAAKYYLANSDDEAELAKAKELLMLAAEDGYEEAEKLLETSEEEDDDEDFDDFLDYISNSDPFFNEDELDKLINELALCTRCFMHSKDFQQYDECMSTVTREADNGNVQSQITAALYFIANAKNEDDLARAKEWLNRAAEAGNEEAAELLEKHFGEE